MYAAVGKKSRDTDPMTPQPANTDTIALNTAGSVPVSQSLLDSAAVAVARARTEQTDIYFTLPVAMPRIDPLLWMQGQTSNPAVYWHSRNDRAEYACTGVAACLMHNGIDAMEKVCARAESLLRCCCFPPTVPPRERPRLFGGFAFEGGRSAGPLWQDVPDAWLVLPEAMLISDDEQSRLLVTIAVAPGTGVEAIAASMAGKVHAYTADPAAGGDLELPAITTLADHSDPEKWAQAVGIALEKTKRGDLEKVVLARRLDLHTSAPLAVRPVMSRLRRATPGCFHFAYRWKPGFSFVGASPERLFKLDNGHLETDCIAGTIGRGTDTDADHLLGDLLLASAKDRLEHNYVMQEVLSGLDDLCERINADARPRILKLSTLQHLVTVVRGHVRTGVTVGEILSRLHPTPAVGGVPRAAALAAIRELEEEPRGWYAGPVGWMTRDQAEFAVAIRSAIVTPRGASVFAGAGIVPGSTPEKEWRETENKAHAFVKAVWGHLA